MAETVQLFEPCLIDTFFPRIGEAMVQGLKGGRREKRAQYIPYGYKCCAPTKDIAKNNFRRELMAESVQLFEPCLIDTFFLHIGEAIKLFYRQVNRDASVPQIRFQGRCHTQSVTYNFFPHIGEAMVQGLKRGKKRKTGVIYCAPTKDIAKNNFRRELMAETVQLFEPCLIGPFFPHSGEAMVQGLEGGKGRRDKPLPVQYLTMENWR